MITMADESERKIPVFTVLKNNVVLKNIFVIDQPPPGTSEPERPEHVLEEILMVGRHPDCNIMLTHPSISRFHLQIYSNPRLQKLAVMDLSSVHGTWVSEEKIKPCVRVELKEGDTIRLGSSSRIYRLHWVPLSRAFDLENPFVSALDVLMEEEKEEEISQDENSFSVDSKEIQSLDTVRRKGMESFFSYENCEPFAEKPIPSAPPELEISDEGKREGGCLSVVEAFEDTENQSPSKKEYEQTESAVNLLPSAEVFLETRSEQLDEAIKRPQTLFVSDENCEPVVEKPIIPSAPPELENMNSPVSDDEKSEGGSLLVVEAFEGTENQIPSRKEYEQMGMLGAVNSLPSAEVLLETRSEQWSEDIKSPQNLFVSDENCEPAVDKPILSAPPEPENLNSPVSDEGKREAECLPVVEAFEELENQIPPGKEYEQTEMLSAVSLLPSAEVFLETRNEDLDEEIKSPQPPFVSEVFSQGEMPMGLPTKSGPNSKLLGSLDSSVADDKIELPLVAEAVEEVENQSPPRKVYEQRKDSGLYHGALTTESVNSKLLGSLDSSVADDKIELPLAAEAVEEVENQSPPRKVYEQREDSGLYHGALTTESVNSSVPDRNVFSDMGNQQFSKENQAPKPLSVTLGHSDENQESPPGRLEQNSSLPNIWSRRGKPASVLQIQTSRSRRKSVGGGSGAKIRKPKQEDLENKQISKALLPELDGEEMEIFTPNKENFSPNTLLLKSMNKKGILVETKQSKLCRSSSSKFFVSPNNCSEEHTSPHSDKENHTPQVLQIQKSVRPSHENTSRNHGKLEREIMVMKRGAERLPFHTLIENASGKSKSEVSVLGAKTRSSNSVNCSGTTGNAAKSSSFNNSAGQGKRRWNMVVDSTCLLNKESRKSLQLLQGLKGTQLIIPRMVIRELDCLKRRGSLLRRTSEASLVLQWIEECMVKTKWWIHVQSSVEEGRPIAPTPPASPRPRFSEGSEGFTGCMTISVPFSACGSLMEIVSPTAEDHILEYALFFKKIKNDGQLVLLTNDVTLKIKAMAEGLICETVEEFRESLVSPFSERFMWSESSPRGQTWSCLDDVVLREKYYPCPLKKASKGGESAKGLKLILLHNSHYRKISSTTS